MVPGPSTIIGRKQEHRLLVEALRSIKLKHQIVLELYFWEQMEGAEPTAAALPRK